MKNNDNLLKFLFETASVRGELVHLEHSFQAIAQQHNYPPAIQQLLGEALAAVNLLSGIIKFKGRLTIQFQGKDDLKLLLVQCDHDLHFRGLVQWVGAKEPQFSELIDLLKQGTLAIMIDPEGTGKQRYQGIVAWQGESLAESIEGYFRDSEQLPTRIWIAVNETHAAGLLLQVLPAEEKAQDWEHIVCLTQTLKSEELLQCDSETLLHRLYHQEEVRVFEPLPVSFRCTCSTTKGENALLLLGQQEAEEELAAHQSIVVTCDFCSKEFVFDRVDVANVFKKGNGGSQQVH